MIERPICERYSDSVMKIYNKNNMRSALLDFNCMSVYFFRGNRRVIATEHLNGKTVAEALKLCGTWVNYGTYEESDFAA